MDQGQVFQPFLSVSPCSASHGFCPAVFHFLAVHSSSLPLCRFDRRTAELPACVRRNTVSLSPPYIHPFIFESVRGSFWSLAFPCW